MLPKVDALVLVVASCIATGRGLRRQRRQHHTDCNASGREMQRAAAATSDGNLAGYIQPPWRPQRRHPLLSAPLADSQFSPTFDCYSAQATLFSATVLSRSADSFYPVEYRFHLPGRTITVNGPTTRLSYDHLLEVLSMYSLARLGLARSSRRKCLLRP